MESDSGVGLVALLQPSLSSARVSLRRDDVEVAFVAGTGGVEGLPPMLRLVAHSFEIAEWLVEVGGFQRQVLCSPTVIATTAALGIVLVACEPRPAEG